MTRENDAKVLADNLEACLNDAMLGRGQTLGNLQRRLRVDAVVGMRLLALREACYAVIAALSAPRPSGEREAEDISAYCKDGETAVECVRRNRADVDSVLSLLVKAKREAESLRTSLEAARAALAGLVQAWDSAPAEPTFNQALAAAERFGPAFAVARAVLAGSAPPTVEAPADLVALVREWQAAKQHIDALNEDGGGPSPEAFSAACDHIDAATTTTLLAWSPADAPAPVQAEMPPLRIGDVVLFGAKDDPPMWRRVSTHYEVGEVGARTDLKAVYGPRWVRPTGQE